MLVWQDYCDMFYIVDNYACKCQDKVAHDTFINRSDIHDFIEWYVWNPWGVLEIKQFTSLT
jgi:hypothetical protein